MEIAQSLFAIAVFPGLLFLSAYGTFLEWADRRLYALMQNRVGPRWYQPVADFVKLLAKEVIVPKAADRGLFLALPYFALAAVATSAMMIPFWGGMPACSFQGDLVVVVYLLTIPTVTFFLAGWSSTSPYSAIGAVRVITQLFAYEVPLMLAVLGPAVMAGSWNIYEIADFFGRNKSLIPLNGIGFMVAVVALQGKLERVPFDIPHGETEIVGGAFTEYSGRLFGFMRLATDMEMVVGAALVSAVFLGGSMGLPGALGLLVFVLKSLVIVFLLAAMRGLMARIRLEQMI
ncbi:MAG: NADH-quinone oxidoreductase subunit H, partial [Elusimicrobia bacterium]|nr:NADH-quinone oxidoreductase subunit H [Elusimicrobiota bacterium]